MDTLVTNQTLIKFLLQLTDVSVRKSDKFTTVCKCFYRSV